MSETCCTQLAEKYRTQKSRQKIAIWAPSYNVVGLYLRNEGTYRQWEKNLLSSNISSRYCCLLTFWRFTNRIIIIIDYYYVPHPHNTVNFGPLAAEIGLPV